MSPSLPLIAENRLHARPQPLPDIEDACGICEPMTMEWKVTAFPMKVDRKKAREELDIVNVVEWRRDMSSQQRFFLLIRRPETGMFFTSVVNPNI